MPLAPHRAAALALALLIVIVAGCAGASEPDAPLSYDGTAYQRAGATMLDESPPQELPGLRNVFQLSDQIISGSEPQGEQAFDPLTGNAALNGVEVTVAPAPVPTPAV